MSEVIQVIDLIIVGCWKVAASTQKEADAHIPNYPSIPPRLICLLDNVTLHVRLAWKARRIMTVLRNLAILSHAS